MGLRAYEPGEEDPAVFGPWWPYGWTTGGTVRLAWEVPDIVDPSIGSVVGPDGNGPLPPTTVELGDVHQFVSGRYDDTMWVAEADAATRYVNLWRYAEPLGEIANPSGAPFRGIAVDDDGFVYTASGSTVHRHVGDATAVADPGECTQLTVCDDQGDPFPGPPVDDGSDCGGTSACAGVGVCVSGTCTDQEPVDCGPAPACHTAECDPVDGCEVAEDPDGTPCDDGECFEGVCEAGLVPALCVATEGPAGVVCFDEDGIEVASASSATSPGQCPVGCSPATCPGPTGEECREMDQDPLEAYGASAITELDGELYFTSNNLCQLMAMDVLTLQVRSVPMCHRINQNDVNGLTTWGDTLVMVSEAGGYIHLLDPTASPAELPAWVQGLDHPLGFTEDPDTGRMFVLEATVVHELVPMPAGGVEATPWFDLTAVDPGHRSHGGLVIHDGVLFYGEFGEGSEEGHVIGVDLASGQVVMNLTIADNPRGLVVDPAGVWLYISRQSLAQLPAGPAPGASIDRLLLTTVLGTPVVETWLAYEPQLQDPFDLVWTALALP